MQADLLATSELCHAFSNSLLLLATVADGLVGVVPRLLGGVATLLVMLRPGVSGADPAEEVRCEMAGAPSVDAAKLPELFGGLTFPESDVGMVWLNALFDGV